MRRMLLLAAEFLEDLSERMGNAGCNDWRWPADFTPEQRKALSKACAEFNGAPTEEYGNEFGPPDFVVVDYLARCLRDSRCIPGGGENIFEFKGLVSEERDLELVAIRWAEPGRRAEQRVCLGAALAALTHGLEDGGDEDKTLDIIIDAVMRPLAELPPLLQVDIPGTEFYRVWRKPAKDLTTADKDLLALVVELDLS